jgi:hypothetical protein
MNRLMKLAMRRRQMAGRVTADSYATDSYTGTATHTGSPLKSIEAAEAKAGITNTGSVNGIDQESAALPTEKDAALLKLIEAIEGVIKPGQKPAAAI